MFKPVVLIILDGWGVAPPSYGNAVTQAKLPFFGFLTQNYLTKTLQASGEAVGLLYGEPGNSEVGHLNLGAGKIVYQTLAKINLAIIQGGFAKNQAFLKAIEHTKLNKSNLHLIGLVSNGGVHSLDTHLYALLDLCKSQGLNNVIVHCILDGRDVSFNSGINFIRELEKRMNQLQVGRICSLVGRFYAMDRDNHWERTEKAYRAMVYGEGEKFKDPIQAIEHSYQEKIYDEEMTPKVIDNQDKPFVGIKENDSVIFFNYRADRARQLTKAFVEKDFKNFPREKINNLFFVSMTEYEKGLEVNEVAFPPENIAWPIARVISEKGLNQLHVAETEKYAHVTFFFNGGREKPFLGEDREMIPSPSVSSYALKPEMSAKQVAEKVLLGIESQRYSFIVVNFANPDMVGHTGDLQATIKALEHLDGLLVDIVDLAQKNNWYVVITADHGNAEEMINLKTGEIDKEHSTNPVPFILVGREFKRQTPLETPPDLSNIKASGVLADVSPTILKLMGIEKPKEMTGFALF